MMTALPVLLLRDPRNLRDHQRGYADSRRVRVENLWLGRPAWVVLITLGSCAVAPSQFHKLHFDYDLLHMQSQSLPSVVYEKKLIRHSGGAALTGMVMADSLRQALDDPVAVGRSEARRGNRP